MNLLSRFIPFDSDNTVTINELKHLPDFRFNNWMKVFDVIGGVEYLFFAVPGCWIPFVQWFWRLPAVLASGTMISREIEDRTWNPLRTTALSVREIVYAKYAAVFRYMEPHITLVMYIRAVPVLIMEVAWFASTFVILPQQGFFSWLGLVLAFLTAGAYVLISPFLDVAVDGAIGILASSFAQRRSSGVIISVLARATGWLLPVAFAVLIQYGLPTTNLLFTMSGTTTAGMSDLSRVMVTLRAITVVALIGPGYAYLWGLAPWVGTGLVVSGLLFRLGLIRLLLELTVIRAGRIEV
jgi:hypothetical protein